MYSMVVYCIIKSACLCFEIESHCGSCKVRNDSRCSRTLPMNVAIESAHCGCERNLCKDWVWPMMYGKHGQILSKAEHCIKQ